MNVVTLVISVLALLLSVFSLVFKRVGPKGERGAVGPQGPQGEKGEQGEKGKDGKNGKNGHDGVSIIKEGGDISAEDIVRLLSTLNVIDLGKNTIIKCDGYFDVD